MQLPHWSTPAERQPGWELTYAKALQRHIDMPFMWGISDCLTVPADLCDAMCGRNPLPGAMRTYRTEEAAMALLADLGFADVEQALEAVFPRIPVSMARRGDAGVILVTVAGKQMLTTLIVMGEKAVGKGERGPVLFPTLRMKSAFAIGAR